MADNQDIAILNQVNQLAQSWGMKPSDFLASVRYPETNEHFATSLQYELCPSEDEKKGYFFRMLSDLGIKGDDWTISGDAKDILNALDRALERSPRARSR